MNLLHIGHNWGGGLTKWIETFPAIDGGRNLFLKFDGGYGGCRNNKFQLIDLTSNSMVFNFDLEEPIWESEIERLDYLAEINKILKKFEIDTMIVSSLIGHSLSLFDADVKKAYVFHDYFGYCPHINITFKGTCNSCNFEKIEKCFKENDLQRFFEREPIHWHKYRKRFVEKLISKTDFLISPDRSVTDNIRTLVPQLNSVQFFQIPHYIKQKKANVFRPQGPGEKPRILFPFGGIDHKGADIFVKLSEKYGEVIDFYCYGYKDVHTVTIEKLVEIGMIIKNYGVFKEDDLSSILSEISPHLTILPCKVPETFSYTLSEMFNFGIPVLASSLGSFSTRVQPEFGILTKPIFDDFEKIIIQILEDPTFLNNFSKSLEEFPTQTVEHFIYDYKKVFESEK